MRLRLSITVIHGGDTAATVDLAAIGISEEYWKSLTKQEKEVILDQYITEYVFIDSFEESE